MENCSDLLFEISNNFKKNSGEGFKKQTFLGKYDLVKTHIEILNDKGANLFNREIGSYTSIYLEKLSPYETDIKNYCIEVLSEIIKDYIYKINKKAEKFLIVGIGNKNYVSDSLGPLVTNQLIVTRHAKLSYSKYLDDRLKTTSVLTPSVLGVTGIETFDIVKGVIDNINPEIVILIDSILSKSYNYIGKCFQVSNRGFIPGSGVENARKILDENSLKVPVISLGVPLVISAQNLLNEYINKDIKKLNNLIVTNKDIDILVKNASNIVATSINMAIHNKMSFSEILDYMQ